jgi:type II secretory pathway pseudopilin PulG
MKHIKKISDYAVVGGLGAILVTGLVGCQDKSTNEQQQGQNNAFSQASQAQGAFVVVEQLANGGYTIADEFPAQKTTIVLRKPDGSERILSQAEIDALVKEENVRIDNGTSPLTNPEISSGNMGLGGILLSSIAGAMIGSWIGNKLFNNQNFQNQRRTQYKSPQTYSKSQNSFKKAAATAKTSSSSKKSGFFGSKSSSSKSKSSFFGG